MKSYVEKEKIVTEGFHRWEIFIWMSWIRGEKSPPLDLMLPLGGPGGPDIRQKMWKIWKTFRRIVFSMENVRLSVLNEPWSFSIPRLFVSTGGRGANVHQKQKNAEKNLKTLKKIDIAGKWGVECPEWVVKILHPSTVRFYRGIEHNLKNRENFRKKLQKKKR